MLCFQVVFPYVYITWTRGRLTESLKGESAPCWLTKLSPCIAPSSVIHTAHISLCVEIQHPTCFNSTTTSRIKLCVLSCQTAGQQEEGRRPKSQNTIKVNGQCLWIHYPLSSSQLSIFIVYYQNFTFHGYIFYKSHKDKFIFLIHLYWKATARSSASECQYHRFLTSLCISSRHWR